MPPSKKIRIRFDTPEEVIFVDADPLRLEQVFWNLLNNALKFTPAGGSVTIRLSSRTGRFMLIVEDNGPGIEPEFLPHVFEMFRQADGSSSRPHSGMGIGLALVRQLMAAGSRSNQLLGRKVHNRSSAIAERPWLAPR
jgi:signal transduction histidine kinase